MGDNVLATEHYLAAAAAASPIDAPPSPAAPEKKECTGRAARWMELYTKSDQATGRPSWLLGTTWRIRRQALAR
jgi:hypothetical protein